MRSFFRSNNLVIDRFNRAKPIDTSGPILLSASTLSGFLYFNSTIFVWESYAGYTLSATPAVWSAGTTILSAGWYIYSPTLYRGFMADINTTTYTVTENDALSGYRFGWREVVQKNSITKFSNGRITKATKLPNTPPSTNLVGPPYGNPTPGGVLIKPIRSWYTPPNLPITSISGIWYKNGQSTGVTLSTYSNTSNGDLIQYRETAVNSMSSSIRFSQAAYINSQIPIVMDSLSSNVISRVVGLSGGAKYMNMFSVKNHNTKTYVRNPNFWANDIKQEFTGCAVHKTFGYESYGGVLITPRHVLYCAHAFPHALGTWPIDLRVGNNITFVRSDNTSLTAMQLHQQPNIDVDLCVAVLDRNMENEGLNIVKIGDIMGNYISYYSDDVIDDGSLDPNYIFNTLRYNYNVIDGCDPLSAKPLIEVGVSQGFGNIPNAIPPTPIIDYPAQNDIMGHVNDVFSGATNNNSISGFKYQVWGGDSGTPVFLLHQNELYLHGIMVMSPWGRRFVSTYIDEINELIHQADLNAISMGRLTETTGYTVSATPLIQ
jgi:hypothetical protein